jgi:hypothetical protein
MEHGCLPGFNRPAREVNNCLQSSDQVKKEWSNTYTYSLRFVDRENLPMLVNMRSLIPYF